MIAVALPGIATDFNESISSAAWLITAYLVVMASVQPLAGKIGDNMGRRKLILGSLILFLAASIGAALAANIWILLAFRVGQALSIAAVISNNFAILRLAIPSNRRGKVIGTVEAVTGISAAAGPIVGGLLITVSDWRAIFFVNIPIVIFALVLAWQALPRDSRSSAWKGFDYRGAVLLPVSLVAVASFFLLLSRGSDLALVVSVGLGAVALFALLLKLELAHPDPVFQPRFFKIRGFAAPSLSIGTSNLSMYSLLLVIPLLLTARGGFTELEIGLILTSLSVGMALFTPIGGRLADRFGRRFPVVIGLVILALGALIPALSGSEIGIFALVTGIGIVGIGYGLGSPAMRTSAVEAVPPKDAGAGSGTYSTSRYFGSIIGSAIIAGLIGVDRSNAEGIDLVFIVVAISATAAVIASLFMVPRPDTNG